MENEEKKDNKQEKKEEAQPISTVTFTDSNIRAEVTTPKQEPQIIPPKLKKLFGKFAKNRKYVVYSVLALILVLAILPRLYTAAYPSLIGTDSFWQYRHSKEIYEHGYPGTELKALTESEKSVCWREPACTFDRTKVYWDTLHDAPGGSAAPVELYQYFNAYSYKYLAKLFFPTLLDWVKFTPVFFALLSSIGVFLLGRELFGDITGLAASFLFSFSGTVVVRSTAGYSDSDMLIIFLFITTFYLFLLAWKKKSFKMAAAAGVSLGLAGFASPGGYTAVPIILIGATVLYFLCSIVSGFLKKKKILDLIKEEWKNYSILLICIAIGLAIVALIESPFHANIFQSLLKFIQIKAPVRTIAAAGSRNVLLTVSEFASISPRFLIYIIHVSLLALLLVFAAALPMGLKEKIKGDAYKKIFLAVFFIMFLVASLKAIRFIEFFIIPAAIIGGLSIQFLLEKINAKKFYTSVFVIVFLVLLLFVLPNIKPPVEEGKMYQGSYFATAFEAGIENLKYAQGDLSPAWLEFFNWLKQNTNKNNVFASWWDYGHELAALAERPVVIDGSQSYERVSAMAQFFTTTNVTEALSILKQYNTTYIYTSSDMVGKYASISYLATGNESVMTILPLTNIVILGNNTTNYIYSFKNVPNSGITATVDGSGEADASLIYKYNATQIGQIYYVNNNQLTLRNNTGNNGNFINQTFYFTAEYAYTIPLLGSTGDSMFIRLHLFDASGLEDHFQAVKSFGRGTIKLYKVVY